MKLDSVRELKQTVLQSSVGVLAANAQALAVRGVRAQAVKDLDPIQRSMALGISHQQKNDYRLAVRVQSRSMEGSPELEKLLARAKGEVDVRYVGRILKRGGPNLQARQRPLLVGCSVGHFDITAGTLGCFVRRKTGGTLILSNNHVLANENDAKKGDVILQPGKIDGGRRPGDVVATLDKQVRLKVTAANLVDCALAKVVTGIDFDPTTLAGLGGLQAEPAEVDGKIEVHKVGRTTGTTHGRVTAFELDNVVVGYDLGNLRFDGQIEIEGKGAAPFSRGGDSGSVIVNDGMEPVALLFAGGDQGGSNGQGLTYANPIGEVLKALGVVIFTGDL